MVNTECSTASRKPALVPVIAENEAWTGTSRPGRRRAVANPSRRLDRVSMGLWLGGVTLGTGAAYLAAACPTTTPSPRPSA